MNETFESEMQPPVSCSVIIRTKDRPRQLSRSLESLRCQTRKPDDIVVVNDGGRPLDALLASFSDLPLTCVDNKTNLGRSRAGNLGVENARGDAICFLDDDDLFFEDHIQRLELCLRRFDARVAYSGCVQRKKDLLGKDTSVEQSVTAGEFNEPFDPDRLRFENYIPLITLMIEKSLFQQVGGFDNRFNLFEDWDLLIRLAQKTRFYHLDKITTEYAIWGSSQQITLSSRTHQWRNAYAAVFKKHFLPLSSNKKTRLMADYWITSQDRRSRIQAIQKELSRHQELCRQYQQDAEKYQDCARDLQSLQAHKQHLEERVRELEPDHLKMKERIQHLEQQIQKMEPQNQKLYQQIQKLEPQNQKLHQQVQKLESQNQKLELYNQKLIQRIQASNQLIDTLKKKVDRINSLRELLEGQQALTSVQQARNQARGEDNSLESSIQNQPHMTDIPAEHYFLLTRWIQTRDVTFKTTQNSLVQTHAALQEEMAHISENLEQIQQMLDTFWIRQKIRQPAIHLLEDLSQKKHQVSQLLARAEKTFNQFQPLLPESAVSGEQTQKALTDCTPLYELYSRKKGAFLRIHSLAYETTTPIPVLPHTCIRFFVYSTSENLSRIDLVFGTYGRINTCMITFCIFDDTPSGNDSPPLRAIEFNAMDIINNRSHPVVFEPIRFARNRFFRVEITSTNASPGEHVAVWCHDDQALEQMPHPSPPQLLSMTTHMQTQAWLAACMTHLPLNALLPANQEPDHIFAIHVPFHDPGTGLIAGTGETWIPMILTQLNHLIQKREYKAGIILYGQTSEKLQQYCRTNHLIYIPYEQECSGSVSYAPACTPVPEDKHIPWIFQRLTQMEHTSEARFIWLLDGTWLLEEDAVHHVETLFSRHPDTAMVIPLVHNARNTVFHGFGQMSDAGTIIRVSAMLPADHPGNRYCRTVDSADTPGCIIKTDVLKKIDLATLKKYLTRPYQITDLIWQLKHTRQRNTRFDAQIHFMTGTPRQAIFSHDAHERAISQDTALKEDAEIFQDRWEKQLDGLPPGDETLHPLLNPEKKITALVVDDKMPTFDEDSGALRMFEILQLLARLDIRVTFFPSNRDDTAKYRHALEELGIEVFCGPYDIHDALICREYDIIIISRVAIAHKHIHLLKKTCPRARLYYDTVDIHYIRELRQAEIENNAQLRAHAGRTRQMELSNAILADVVFTVTEEDARHLRQEIPALNCFVLPNIHRPRSGEPPREKREGLVFIGNYNHHPNVDAVFYFVEHVFPLILERNPEIQLYLVGSHMREDMKALASDHIRVLGWVEQVEPVLAQRRVMVSYLRYGAGMKGKIGQAMSLGLPVVSTTIGAEGMGLSDGKDALVADDPATFAEKVCRLYTDQDLWETIARNAKTHVSRLYGPDTIQNRLHDFLKKDLGRNYADKISDE